MDIAQSSVIFGMSDNFVLRISLELKIKNTFVNRIELISRHWGTENMIFLYA